MVCKFNNSLLNHVVVTTSICVLSACMFVFPGLAEPPKDEAIQQLSNADNSCELAKFYQQIFGEATIEQLEKFKSQSDCRLAIPAGWELLRRTLPKESRDDIIHHDEKALSKFLDSVEDHIKVDVPSAWRKTVISAYLSGRSDIGYVMPGLKIPHVFIEDERGSRPAILRSADDGFEFVTKDKNEIWKIPPLESPLPLSVCARLEVTKEKIYYAIYHNVPSAFDLQAMDRESGKITWSMEVWAVAYCFGGGSGNEWHYVDFVVNDEKLIVFGVSGRSIYIEIFDVKTGKNLSRFSQDYFEIDLEHLIEE